MRTVIGDKSRFAIEYEIQSKKAHVMGTMRLWIEGIFIGAIQDVNILSAILCHLETPSPKIQGYYYFNKITFEDIYYLIYRNDDPNDAQYCFDPGESFDDFWIIYYCDNDYYNFIWRLHDNPYFEYPNYPTEVQNARVAVDEYHKIVMAFGCAIR